MVFLGWFIVFATKKVGKINRGEIRRIDFCEASGNLRTTGLTIQAVTVLK